MRYLITLKPLTPFFFGGSVTFGKLGDKENSTYLVKSRLFPQQTAILGMIRKEYLIQNNLLTKKVNGDWVDKENVEKAKKLVGSESFDMKREVNFGVIEKISPIFLIKQDKKYIKKVNIDSYKYKDGILENYNPKYDIYDNFVSTDNKENLKTDEIFKSITKVGIKKSLSNNNENSYFKQTFYTLQDNFKFAFYLDTKSELKSSIIQLGADNSMFKMDIKKVAKDEDLTYKDKNGYLVLLSDSCIDTYLKGNCEFAITSEISFSNLKSKIDAKTHKFEKSNKVYFYERGSVIINPSDKLINHLNKNNLQKIGYNKYTKGENNES